MECYGSFEEKGFVYRDNDYDEPFFKVVDSQDVETNIRGVFGETLLEPAQFRSHENPTFNEDEDFSQRYPVVTRLNFYKEFKWFREQESIDSFDELCIDMLLDFAHSRKPARGLSYSNLCTPHPIDDMTDASLKIPARRPHIHHTSTTHAISFDVLFLNKKSQRFLGGSHLHALWGASRGGVYLTRLYDVSEYNTGNTN